MQAIGYIRVSTEEQATEGVSLEMQRAKIEAWSDLTDAELVAIYADEGLSGKNTKRDGLQQALEAAKAHQAALVVYSLSRLSRSTIHTLTIAEELQACGCELVSLQEKIDTTTPAGRVVFRVLAALAEFEREQLAERTRHGMAHKKAQGFRVGSIPHGYQLEGDRLVPNEKEQERIALVAELRSHGLSLRKISAELESRGVFNRHDRPYNAKSIASMLMAA